MTPTTTPPSGRVLAALAAVAAVLAAAFVVVPPALTGITSERQLTDRFRAAFVEYWATGGRDLTPRLESLVDTWFWFHVAKTAIAALLLAVLVALGAALWRAFLHAGGGRAAVACAGVTVTLLGLAALVLVMANLQGAATPFASLLPMLVDGPADGRLAGTLDEVRQRLATAPTSPAADVMISGFAGYHAAMAVIATVVAAALAVVAVRSWRRYTRTPRSGRGIRRAAASFGALMTVSALAVAVVAVANTGTAADPAPALAAFFAGGW